jgi:hypothetical protein
MQRAHPTRPGDWPAPSKGLERVAIDPSSGKRATSGGIEEIFLTGTAPTEAAEPELPALPELPPWPF